jgi:predicted outer membrane repeat protein
MQFINGQRLSAALIVFFALQFNAYADTVTVPGDYDNIAAAIAAAQLDANITQISLGTQIDETDVEITGISQDLLIIGATPSTMTVMNANNEGRHFNIYDNSGIISFNHIEFTNGYMEGDGNSGLGGSVKIAETAVSFYDCQFITNYSLHSGGAIFSTCIDEGSLSLAHCVFENNHSDNGGGAVFISFSVSVSINSCEFTNNSASGGGAIYLKRDAAGVIIDGSIFTSNSASGGGAIYLERMTAFQGLTFDNNTAAYGSAIFGKIPTQISILETYPMTNCVFKNHTGNRGSVIYCEHFGDLHLNDCSFHDNSFTEKAILTAFYSNVSFQGCSIRDNYCEEGKLIYAVGEHTYFFQNSRVKLINTLVADNICNNTDSSPNEGLIYAGSYADLESHGSTFVNNTTNIGCGSNVGVFVANTPPASITLNSTNVSFNRDMSSNIVAFGLIAIVVEYTDIYGNTFGDWVNGFSGRENLNGNLHVNPQYVNFATGDYRLVWNSPLMDFGSPISAQDWDLTRADIGWTPKYNEVEVSGTTTLTMRGWYKVVGYTTFTGSDLVIPEGTTIRNDDGYTMIFSDTDNTNGYNIVVGDPDGARTAIVGSLDSGSIVFGSSATSPNQAATSFNGVLFNRAPDFYNGALWFSYCDVDLNGAGGNIKFNAYQNTEVVFDAVCYGQFRNFDFTATHIQNGVMGIGCIDVQYSDVDVLNNTFDRINDYPNNWYWKLMHYGTVPNPSHIIASNQFNAKDNGDLNFPVLLGGATLNLHHNVFDNVEAGAILAGSATLNMKNGANNRFNKENVTGYNAYPMIEGIQSYVDLECGYNAFVKVDISEGYQFIVSSGGSTNWAYNFWGEDCDNGESPENHIPGFVTTFSPWLTTCPTLFVPCQGQGGENDLYALGQEAAEIENHEAAVVYWIELLEEYPQSKYATEVTGIVKAIGLYTEYGAEDYPLIRAGLESAADESEPVDELLSVFQVCSAWCVEAMHGDRPAAVALLDSLLIEKDGYAKAELLINTALAEIATYPAQGQMSALGPEMEAQRIDRRRQALRNLQRVLVPAMAAAGSPTPDLESGKAKERPSTFGIRSCHPNPFNPTTTLDVQVDGEEALSLEIFNTLGQRVAVLHEGFLPAGAHTFRWTAGQVATGVYLARAVQGRRVSVAKVILVR